MIVLVCGDRFWCRNIKTDKGWQRGDGYVMDPDYDLLWHALNDMHFKEPITALIEGEAPGADQLSGFWAEEWGIPVLRFPADWNRYGKAAGPIRNRQQFDEGKPDRVVAFHRNLAESRGTRDMVNYAKSRGCPVEVYPLEQP